MNKTAIKSFAIWARETLIEAVKQRAFQYEITEDTITDSNADIVSGKPLTKEEKEQRRQLIEQISRKGFESVMEEVAYTWFNRFIALRFMEVNGYLPTKIRVFTDVDGSFRPEILKEALTVELPVDKSRVMELLENQNNEELFKLLIIAQCNELSNSLPGMFEVISNYTEILFPNYLLKDDSILGELVNRIPEEDWTDAVQIIGWLFEGYVFEQREILRKEVTITKKSMATVNQVFTPDWVVKYMVENTIGHIWLDSHPNSVLKDEFKYYIDTDINEIYKSINPTDIRIIEPCCGSGHVLAYAFDVLVRIYEDAGYVSSDIPSLILENNLYGFDIDGRAAQLAYFSLMMKARSVDRRFLRRGIQPHIYEFPDSTGINNDYAEMMQQIGFSKNSIEIAEYLVDVFSYGKVLGTTLKFEKRDYSMLLEEMTKNSNNCDLVGMSFFESDAQLLSQMCHIAIELTNQFDVVITNPPYSFLSKLEDYPKQYLLDNYPSASSKCNFCSIYLESDLVKPNGYLSMITSLLWTKQKSFEAIRKKILTDNYIESMVFIGVDEVNAFVETNAFVIRNAQSESVGKYYSVEELDKRSDFIDVLTPNKISQKVFLEYPSFIISSSLNQNDIAIHQTAKRLADVLESRDGLHTCNNDLFLRLWPEVNLSKVGFNYPSPSEAQISKKKWFPYCKGGDYRKWYGDNDYLINWENDGYEIKNLRNPTTGKVIAHNFNGDYAFLEGFTWTYRSSTGFAVRYCQEGFLFDSKGSKAFAKENKNLLYVIGFLNSSVGRKYIYSYSTTSFEVGMVLKMPFVDSILDNNVIADITEENINLERKDWDSTETSWDFKVNPLI